jgi:hypothetical protein
MDVLLLKMIFIIIYIKKYKLLWNAIKRKALLDIF